MYYNKKRKRADNTSYVIDTLAEIAAQDIGGDWGYYPTVHDFRVDDDSMLVVRDFAEDALTNEEWISLMVKYWGIEDMIIEFSRSTAWRHDVQNDIIRRIDPTYFDD